MILTDTGRLTEIPQKIVSLVPSQTELLYDLGLNNETIAITRFCIHPKQWYDQKTRIGGTKALDIEKIKALNPDLIIANKEENVKEQVEQLAEHFRVWVTDVNDLCSACQMISDIGHLTGKAEKAAQLVIAIQNEFEKIQLPLQKRRTAYLIWKDPYMTIGGDTFIHDMLVKAGMENVFADQQRYPEISITELKEKKCDQVLLSSEPYPFREKHILELKENLPGVQIRLVDGEMFSWYGSHLLKAPEYFNNLNNTVL